MPFDFVVICERVLIKLNEIAWFLNRDQDGNMDLCLSRGEKQLTDEGDVWCVRTSGSDSGREFLFDEIEIGFGRLDNWINRSRDNH